MSSTVPITADLPVFPHLDLHLVLTGNLPLKIQVFSRTFSEAAPKPFVLTDRTNGSVFHFFAPYHPTGSRLTNLPSVSNSGIVTATEPGVYLFQITVNGGFGVVVGRLQVHEKIEDWWFGNKSITTTKDSNFAHAQPSLYARFSEHPAAGTDAVGDITGHDYIDLTSPSPNVVIAPRGRLRGTAETTAPVTVSGTLKGTAISNTLPVRVVDHAKPRTTLKRVRATDVVNHEDQVNMVFVAEGFEAKDAQLFDRIVQRTVRDMFEKPRHQPYGLLSKSFNVFSVFEPSEQQLVTCGPRVVDRAGQAGRDFIGRRIPESDQSGFPENSYSVQQLVERVGLPQRGESRSPQQLRDLWKGQGLTDFVEGKATDLVIATWKEHQAEGFIEASDTFYGLYLGRRRADRSRFNGQGEPAVQPPASDTPNAPNLKEFIDRVYEFYRVDGHQTLELDPRRHAPEVYANSNATNPGDFVLGYLEGLRLSEPPNPPIGKNWVPDDTKFRKSRGMVAIIAYDPLLGGTAFNRGTLTASTVGRQGKVEFSAVPGARPVRTRTPPPVLPTNPLGITEIDHLVNKVAHEFAHSFNLGDEYEDFGGDQQGDNDPTRDLPFDNLAKLTFLHQGAPPQDRKLNPDKIKWFAVPRMRVSGKLLVPSVPLVSDIFEVTVGTADIAKWVQAWQDNAKVTVHDFSTGADNRQLPLKATPSDVLANLTIATRPDEKQGTLFLQTPGPVAQLPVFKKGSAVFVQRTDLSGLPVFVVDKKVRDFVADPAPANQRSHGPLNRNRDTTKPFGKREEETDLPIGIPGFVPPKFAYQMVGIFEGGNHFAGGFYRASGECKMRGQDKGTTNDADLRGMFCFLCKWLIVNLIDPAQHAPLDAHQYPRA